MSKKVSLKESGASWNEKKIFPETITHKISEVNSRVQVK